MPIYEYRCQSCGVILEFLVRGQAPSACGDKCRLQGPMEERGQGKLERILSAPAAVARPDAIGHEGPTAQRAADAGFTVYKKEDAANRIYRKQAGSGPDWVQR